MLTFFKDTIRDSISRAKTRKAERKFARQQEQDRIDARREREERAVRDQVWKRDQAVCRAYGVPVKRHAENPTEWGHCAHVVSASLGGLYTTDNLGLLSPIAHERIHLRHDHIGLEWEGNADEILTFREFDLETGLTLRAWESPCPSPRFAGQVVETKESPCP